MRGRRTYTRPATTARLDTPCVAHNASVLTPQSDGKWYPGRVVSVANVHDSPVYSVVFTKFKATEALSSADMRPQQKEAHPAPKAPSNPRRPPTTSVQDEEERERKRARKEKKIARESAKQKEQTAKQNAWQKFAKKGAKKGYGIAGDNSMFKTPEDPYAKGASPPRSTHSLTVGVVGGGRGMTQQAQRSKHTYDEEA